MSDKRPARSSKKEKEECERVLDCLAKIRKVRDAYEQERERLKALLSELQGWDSLEPSAATEQHGDEPSPSTSSANEPALPSSSTAAAGMDFTADVSFSEESMEQSKGLPSASARCGANRKRNRKSRFKKYR